jgi:hypothetical protein
MSKQTKQFFEQIKSGEPPTLLETLREAAGTARDIGGQLWDGAKPIFDHGRTELAAALFAGHAHVMYMRGQDGVEHAAKALAHEQESPERQSEGREM